MPAEMERLRVLKEYAPQISDRIELVMPEKLSDIECLERGILFVMAFWSATSVSMFQKLGEVLNSKEAYASIRLWVVDIDDIQDLFELPPFDRVVMGGNGEVFWFYEGQCVVDSGGGFNPDCLAVNTSLLFEDANKDNPKPGD